MRWLLAGALVVAACHRHAPANATPDAGSARPPASSPSLGVRVDLPAGWSFFPAADGSLRAGPKGRTAVRIDPAPLGARLPGPDELAAGFANGLSGLSQQVLKTSQSLDFSSVQLALLHQQQGKGVQHRAFLGARRLGPRVFLCASAPGDTREEVAQAERLCQGMALRTQP